MLTEEIKRHLIQAIVKELEPAFVLLYGSFAKGTNHGQSDIDLAYFTARIKKILDKDITQYENLIPSYK